MDRHLDGDLDQQVDRQKVDVQYRARNWVALQAMNKDRLGLLPRDRDVDQRRSAGPPVGIVEPTRVELNCERADALAIYRRGENTRAAQAIDLLADQLALLELQRDLVCHENVLLVLANTF